MTDEKLEQQVQLIMMEIMMILHKNNIRQVNVGAMMRLLGVANERAAESDDDYMQLDEEFAKYIKNMVDLSSANSSNQTLH
jgi:hypothetical protein